MTDAAAPSLPAAAHPVLLVLAGPAGSGKSTLCDRMVAEVPGFSRVVTATTRSPRPGEEHGRHYHFLSPAAFDEKVAASEFLEWAWVHGSNRYGTLASAVLEPLAAGRNLIINVDVQGVDNFRRASGRHPLLAQCMGTVFIEVPLATLRERMIARGQDSPEEIEQRLRTAEQELREAGTFDFRICSRGRDEDFAALVSIYDQVRRRSR